MACLDQVQTDSYAIFNGDSAEVLQTLPDETIGLSVYSQPFATEGGGCLYNYSSSVRDLSNARTYDEFFVHYGFIVEQITRLTIPGRLSLVHCMDVPKAGANICGYTDFPGDIIREHEKHGFHFCARYHVWKEPLGVRLRTMAKGLAHKQIVDDSSLCDVASADYLLMFRKHGENKTPVTHPTGHTSYLGSRQMPSELLPYKNWTGKQTENRFSHWIWRQYASAFWDDIRIDRVLKYDESRDSEDEKHVHPLQLDVIERAIILRSNPGETVLTPFMGVGSECYGAVINGRKAIGIELKESYFNQARKNLEHAVESEAERLLL